MVKHVSVNWSRCFQILNSVGKSWPARWLATLILVGAAVFLASWVRLLDVVGIDKWFERQFFRLASNTVAKRLDPAIRILYLDEGHKMPSPMAGQDLQFGDAAARQGWRIHHARLLRTLETAGARVVAFDQYFPSPGTAWVDADRTFATAVCDVANGGKTRVVLGMREQDFDEGSTGISQALRGVLAPDRQGLIDVGGYSHELGEPYLGRILIAVVHVRETGSSIKLRTERFIPSLPLQIAMAYRSQELSQPLRARLDVASDLIVLEAASHSGATLRIVDSIRCDVQVVRDREGTHYRATIPLHLADDFELQETGSRPYPDIFSDTDHSEYSGKIVLVGARLEGKPDEGEFGEQFTISPGRKVYGYQVHASITSDLLDGTYPRRLTPGGQFLAILFLAAVAAWSRYLLPKADIAVSLPLAGVQNMPVALLLLACVYLIASTQTYRYTFTLFEPGYHLVALASGYYVCGRSLRRLGKLQARKSAQKTRKAASARRV